MFTIRIKSQGRQFSYILLLVAACFQTRAEAAQIKPPLPVPSPRIGRAAAAHMTSPYLMIAHKSGVSVLLCQAISIEPEVPLSQPLAGAAPRVNSATFAVLETLDGPSVTENISLTNAPVSRVMGMKSGHLPYQIEVVRKGELWILLYDKAGRELDRAHSFWLNGTTDAVLAEYSRHKSWMKRNDSSSVMKEMAGLAMSSNCLAEERSSILLSLSVYYETRLKSPQGLDANAIQQYKQLVANMLEIHGFDHESRMRLVQMTSIDLTHDLTSGSADTREMSSLMSIVGQSRDDMLVDWAANRLYFVMVQQPLDANHPRFYFCPEIVSLLEYRKTIDASAGAASAVDRTLANIKMRHRMSAEEIKARNPSMEVIVRHLPAALVTASEKQTLRATGE